MNSSPPESLLLTELSGKFSFGIRRRIREELKKAAGLWGDLWVSSGLAVGILIWLLWPYCGSCWLIIIQFYCCLPSRNISVCITSESFMATVSLPQHKGRALWVFPPQWQRQVTEASCKTTHMGMRWCGISFQWEMENTQWTDFYEENCFCKSPCAKGSMTTKKQHLFKAWVVSLAHAGRWVFTSPLGQMQKCKY